MSIQNLIDLKLSANAMLILEYLVEHGNINQVGLASALDLSKRQVTYAMKSLREHELIREVPDIDEDGNADFRSKLISLTSTVERAFENKQWS